MRFDVIVLGAGVIGLACAERLSRQGRQVLVVERHPRPLAETSSRNSQVLHAGFYYPAGTWKARLCVRGNRSLAAFCEARGLPFARVGKLVVATDAGEEAELDRLLAQGRANGVPRLERVDAAFVRRLEPAVRAVSALWSPDTGALDVHAVAGALEAEARDRGVTFAFRHAVQGGARGPEGWSVRLAGPDGKAVTVQAPRVVNAGGLDADVVAAGLGLDVDALAYRLRWAKGHYARVEGGPRLAHHVYPVPAAHLAGLGVHATVGLDGSLRLGPDVQWLDAASRTQDYGVPDALADAFHAAAARYWPGLERGRLTMDFAGLRPKRSGPGEPARDFVIAEESAHGAPGLVSLVGLESPGLTCCLEVADEVARLVEA